MMNFKNIFRTFFILTLIVSCEYRQTDNNNPGNQEIPQALQEDKFEIKSYSRSGDLTDALYQELVDKTPALKKLEDDLDAFKPKSNDVNAKFNQYDNKSENYYHSANYKAAAIKDSLLKKRIIALIDMSNKQYSSKTNKLNSLLNQMTKNGTTLNDHYTVLKITLTIPLIEKYQENNIPDSKEFTDLIKEQQNLISKTDSLTPKY